MIKRYGILAGALLLAAQAGAAVTLGDIASKISSRDAVSADFTQVREMEGAPVPLTSKGHVLNVKEKGVIWTQKEPFPVEVRVTKDKIEIRRDGAAPEVVTEESNPRGFAFSRLMSGAASSEEQLKRTFDVKKLTGTPDKWTVVLAPKDDSLKRAFSGITVKGGDAVDEMTFTSGKKSRTTIKFMNTQLDGGVPLTERMNFDKP